MKTFLEILGNLEMAQAVQSTPKWQCFMGSFLLKLFVKIFSLFNDQIGVQDTFLTTMEGLIKMGYFSHKWLR